MSRIEKLRLAPVWAQAGEIDDDDDDTNLQRSAIPLVDVVDTSGDKLEVEDDEDKTGSQTRLSLSPEPGQRTSFLEKIGDLVFQDTLDDPEEDTPTTSSLYAVDYSLHQACSEGAIDVVKEQLRQIKIGGDEFLHEEINRENKKGFTPLHLAAMYNRKNVITQLLENGADINKTGSDDELTPLHVATMYKMDHAAKTLIQNGADVLVRNTYGSSALYFAARAGSHVLVGELLNKGADPNGTDNALSTPLHGGMMSGSARVTELLLKHNADPCLADNEGEMPIHFAAADDQHHLIKLLADAVIKDVEDDHKEETLKSFIDSPTMENDTALHVASQTGYVETVKTLMELGADVNARTDTNASALHLAAIGGHADVVEYLIGSGAKVTASDMDQAHALHKACQYGHVDVIKLLHEHKAHINSQDRDNFTPLMYAVWKGQEEAVKYLLDNKAKLHLKDINGKCVLHIAVEEEQEDMLRLLLDIEGIEKLIDSTDKDFKTPLHYSAKNGNSDVLELLLAKSAEVDICDNEEKTPLHIAAESGNVECVKFIGETSPGIVNATDDRGRSALHLAAMNGHRDTTHCLIEMGSEISCRDEVNWTPLDYAARNGFHKTMIILIDNDAVVDATDKNKMTPLHLASEQGHVECVKTLLDYDASISLLNIDNKNCLELAIENFKEEACMAILENKRWLEALKHLDETGTPVMDKLIKASPEVAECVLNKSVEYSSYPVKHPDYYIKYNFDVLDSHPDEFEFSTYFGPASMVRYKRYNLLSHPLTVRLINDKWSRLGQWLYLPTLLLYMIFVALLTSLLVIDKKRNGIKANIPSNKFNKSIAQEVIPWIIIFLALIQLIKEGMQMYYLENRYFKEMENYIEIVMYILCIAFSVPFIIEALDKNELNNNPSGIMSNSTRKYYTYLENIKWNTGAISILLIWVNLLLYLKRFPTFGIHVVMFMEVLKTLLRVLLCFVFLLFAFSFSFYVLIDTNESFKYPGRSIIKTAVMTIGEFEFGDILVSPYNDPKMLPYKELTFVIFLIFIVIMPILFMNLLVGLAVGDIESVRKQAFIVILKNQVHVLKSLSNTYPKWILRKRYRGSITDEPNKIKWYSKFLNWFRTKQDNSLRQDNDEGNRNSIIKDLKENRVELEKQKKHLKNMFDVLEEHYELSQKIFEHYKNEVDLKK